MVNPLIPNYELLEQIGEGGFGLVYKAKQTNTNQIVAIKVLKAPLNQDLSSNPEAQNGQQASIARQQNQQEARFERETQFSAQINHPNIVKLLDKGNTKEGNLFAVFEYVEGETLKERITCSDGLSAAETGKLMGQVLDALVCAHEQGIVHRDLKPQNIMVTQTGAALHVKVLDFGIGAFTHEYRTKDYRSLTLTKEMVGTPSYSAPEQLRGEPPTVKSDLYAWGLILLECLTGIPVMEGNSLAEVFAQQISVDKVPIPASVLSHPLADLLRRVLEKNPRTRAGNTTRLYEEYTRLNFNTLVGKISRQTVAPAPADDEGTLDSDLELVMGQNTRRQITVLCAKISLVLPEDCALDTEILDALQKDQLVNCSDVAIRYGGHVSGAFADVVGIYFGYPQVTDNDARRAGRTALELISQAQKRSALLQTLHGISLDIRLALHSGEVLIKPNQTPEGLMPNVAFNLLGQTPANAVLVSETTKQLLDPYLEFEAGETYAFGNAVAPLKAFALVGERQTEAMSFLRPWSANRQMIGRDEEQTQILSLWENVKAGKAQSMLVHGQAGIGKSKLIYESKRQLRSEGFVVRECRCLPEHTNNALYPFFDMLRKHWGLSEGEDAAFNISRLEEELTTVKCDLATTLPILCSWLSIPLGEGYEVSQATPEKQKEILLATLEKLIVNIAQTEKFLLIVEDLHWLDPTSLEFLETLLANLEQHNYLLLMTTRPVYVPEWTHAHLTKIELQPLTVLFVKNLVEGVLEGKTVDDALIDYVAKRADGVPLFIEELTHMLHEQDYLVLENNVYQLDNKQDIDAVPITLKDLLNARLDGLGIAKETAQLAATIGRNFEYDLLIKASVRDEAMVQADLDQLMNADLVYRQRRVQGEGYIFRHALIRDAAYEGMTKALQKDTHGRVAVTLEDEFPQIVEENPFEVARHFAGAESFEVASEYGVKMVSKQVGNSSNLEAVSTSKWVLEQVREIDDERNKLETELKALETVLSAVMTVDGFGSEKFVKTSRQMNNTAKLLNDFDQNNGNPVSKEEKNRRTEIIWKSNWNLFLIDLYTSREKKKLVEMGEKMIQEALEKEHEAKENNDLAIANRYRQRRMLVGSHLTQVYEILGLWKKAITCSEATDQLYDQSLDKNLYVEYGIDPKSQNLSLSSAAYLATGRIDIAFQKLHESLEIAEQTRHQGSLIFSYGLFCQTYSFLENPQKVIEATQKYKEKHGSEGKKVYYEHYLYFYGYCAKGNLDEAEKSYATQLNSGQDFAVGLYVIFLAKAHLKAGNFDRAIELIVDALNRSMRSQVEGFTPFLTKTLAQCYYEQAQELSEGIEKLLTFTYKLAASQGAIFHKLDTLVYYCDLLEKHQQWERLDILKQEEVLPLLGRFTEGENTLLIKKAFRLLGVNSIAEARGLSVKNA